MSVKESTGENWKKTLDPSNTWMELQCKDGHVQSVTCQLCRRYENEIKLSRNYNPSFIRGISGSALKKDNLVKHIQSAQHQESTRRSLRRSLDVYTTPLGESVYFLL